MGEQGEVADPRAILGQAAGMEASRQGQLGLAAVAFAGMIFGLGGLIAGIPESLMFAIFLVVGVLYYGMITRVWRALTFLSALFSAMDRFSPIEERLSSPFKVVSAGL